jgi:ABC-type antimicrobial peptide transport system permease subunit
LHLCRLTNQRIPEIGVRMALGASALTVMWLVIRQSLGTILIGIGLAAC